MTPQDYARLAQRAYQLRPQIGVPSSAARAIVEGDAVAFPGSDNLACWLADLDVDVIQVDGLGFLHRGFWKAFSSISTQLLALPAAAVTVGHSEGAALAILFAAALCMAGRPPRAVYGFEPPRVSTDSTLAAVLAAHGVQVNLYRNGQDVVPMVPRLLRAWQHPAPLIEIGRAAWPVPNVEDHKLARVIQALA
ncbi:lipase [Ralstonia pseudosolanacearum]|uniref:lipase family protein n=1 Tax=Ralstonia solanacearum species complex TaxID=3116862 RepID=UPI00336A2E43